MRRTISILSLLIIMLSGAVASAEEHLDADQKPVKKILFIGDSMTGWLSERLNAYGEKNGFEVQTVVWDGSTIKKWASSPRLAEIIKKDNPDAVFVSLGMNELFEANPERQLKPSVEKIKHAVGDRRLLWVGPPSWPGYDKGKVLDDWLRREVGERNYFPSLGLKIPRQSKKNPHPTRTGMIEWMDTVVNWLPQHSDIRLITDTHPGASEMSRGKSFVYKRMKETL